MFLSKFYAGTRPNTKPEFPVKLQEGIKGESARDWDLSQQR
jgi:hypothetical protein